MANLKKLCYFTLPLANIQTLMIKEIDWDLYFSDEKAEYIFLNKPIKTKVLTACANLSKLITAPFQGAS